MKEREAKISPAAKTRLPEAIRRLVDLYAAWDRLEEAMKWQAVLDESAVKRSRLGAAPSLPESVLVTGADQD